MRILVIGADGQLGSDLVSVFSRAGHEVEPSVMDDLDITDREAVARRITASKPHVTVNTAAYTHVDRCESMDEEAFRVNALAVRWLAEACRATKSALVQFSTDYVFDGAKRQPYVEDDPPNPLSAYAISKLAGECYARYTEQHFIVRISGLYGRVPSKIKGYNFVEKMLQLADERPSLSVVHDEVLTPTFALDVARNLAVLIPTGAYGTYHMTNNGQCSWYEFAQEILRLAGKTTPIVPIVAASWDSPARRPPYSVLENRNLARMGLDQMQHWRQALAEYMQMRSHALHSQPPGGENRAVPA